MNNPFKKKEYYTIDYNDLEQLIEKTYGHPYSFVASQESSNDCEHTFKITAEDLDEYDMKLLNKYISGNSEICYPRLILTDMVNKGLIPEGEYLVSVCW